MRAQALSALRRETTNPNSISNRRLVEDRVPGPSLRPADQRHAGIGADHHRATICATITRRVLTRDTLKVAVVGDIDAATLGPCSTACSARCRPRAELDRAAAGAHRRTSAAASSSISTCRRRCSRSAARASPRKDPDFIPAFVVNHILGGGSFSSRLYNEVREKRGLAYGVSSYLLPLDHAALFIGGTQTSNDSAGEALKMIEAEIRRMASEGPTEEELAKAKAYLKGSYRAALRHLDQDRQRSCCRSRSTISASTTSTSATA